MAPLFITSTNSSPLFLHVRSAHLNRYYKSYVRDTERMQLHQPFPNTIHNNYNTTKCTILETKLYQSDRFQNLHMESKLVANGR